MCFKLKKQLLSTILIVAMLLVFNKISVYGQNGNIYNNTNGLITANVNDACQTTDGYIWLAQYEGLTKYDGNEFKNINHITIDGYDVSLDQITCVDNDSQNRLYIGTKNLGLIIYENGSYHSVNKESGLNINDIFVYNDIAYVATTDGAYFYKDNTVNWIEGTPGNSISSICATSNSNIYYIDNNGIVFEYNGNTKIYFNNEIIKTVRAFSNTVYLGSMYGNLICIDKNEQTYKVTENSPINAFAMQDDNLFIGTDSGMFSFDGCNVTELKNLGSDTTINSIFFDYEKSMWVSTTTGLAEFHQFNIENLFNSYGISQKSVNACYYFNDMLYVGTDSGLYIIDESNNSLVNSDITEMLQGIRIRDFEELNGKLYIATYSSKDYDIVTFDGKKIELLNAIDMMETNQNNEAVLSHGQVRCLVAHNNKLLIGTNYGLTTMEGSTYKTIELSPRPLSISTYSNYFYVCTDGNGIHIFDYDLNEIGIVEGTEGKTILRAIEYEGGLLYGITTNLFYQKDGTTTRLNLENTGSIVDLKDMPYGLVMHTNSGVYFINKKSLFSEKVEITNKFNSSNGLTSGVTANGKSFYNQNTSTFYFNCQDGVYKYNINSNSSYANCLKMAIDGILVDGKSIPVENSITLDKHTNRLEINLALLAYQNRENITVFYQMQGADKQISKMDFNKKHTLEYTNLRGGDYTLTVYSVNSNGLKSNSINISIHKNLKWYERTLEQISIVVILILAIVIGTRIRIHLKVKKVQAQSEWRKRMALDSLEAIANTIDAKDDYTKGHSVRVAKLSVCIGKQMHIDETELEVLYYIGLMHDVGKIGIPDNILTKPARLSEEEYNVMREHPTIGHSILKSIKSIPHLEDGVNYHHERFDGTGYPKGLKGEEIPLTGRIICCADCYDAMATKRCYKISIPDEKIILEFENCSGTQFDPKIAKIVIDCIRSGQFRAIINEGTNTD